MRLRNTVLALFLLVGLVAFIYYYEYRGEEGRAADGEAGKSVLTFEREKVQGIEIERPGVSALTLRKESGDWRLAAPLQTRADADRVESILSTLGFLRAEQTLKEVSDAELEQYKLKEPAARVALRLEEGKEGPSLEIGEKDYQGRNYYARVPGSTEVLVVSGGLDEIVSAEPASLRYKKVVGVDLWKVARFSIQKGASAVTLVHGAPGTGEEDWRLERPVSFPADSAKTQSLWFDLQSLEADSFETEQPTTDDLRRAGLSPPAIVLSVEPKEGAAPVRVEFGAPPRGGDAYAKRSDLGAIMKVKREALDKLRKAIADPDDLRDARVAPVDRFRLSRIEVRRPAGSVTLVKDDASRWRWGGEDGPEMASEDVNAFIDALEGCKATQFLDDPVTPDEGEPALALVLHEGSGEADREVTVRFWPQALSGERRRVTSSATSSAYLLPGAAVQTLSDRASSLKAPEPKPEEPEGSSEER